MNVSFIGYGNIAKALARGLLKQPYYSLSAASPSLTVGINQEGIKTHHNNTLVVKNADIIILAVKPMMMRAVLEEIVPELPPHSLLISVATGLQFSWFAKLCDANRAVIRAMPNTPASIGCAATPLIANTYTTTEQKQQAERIFASIGLTTWADKEEDIDSFTALSGSGPAYVFLFLEGMIQAAMDLGLKEPIARSFALQTMEGALKLAQKGDSNLTELRKSVTSKGGTTAAALSVFEPQLGKLIFTAMKAAKQRAIEIAQEF